MSLTWKIQSAPVPASSGWRWGTREPKTRVVAGVALFYLCIPAAILYLHTARSVIGSDAPFNDFFALWSVGRLALTAQIGHVYDLAFLTSFRHAIYPAFDPGMAYVALPYPYPPLFLLFLAPLGLLSYKAAYLAWIASGFSLYCLVAVPDRKWWPAWVALFLLIPANVYSIAFGQNGFLSAVLLTAGLRHAERRPLLGGLLLGLLAFKPQLVLLVPVALISARLWRCFAVAAGTGLLLAVASAAIFGVALWQEWPGELATYSQTLHSSWRDLHALMPTVMMNALTTGAGWEAARYLQLAATVIVAVTLWSLFRRGVRELSIAAVQVGIFVASPFALIYDMPMVAIALVSVIRERDRSAAPFAPWEVAVIALAVILPYLMIADMVRLPFSAPVMGALFALIVRRAMLRQSATDAAPALRERLLSRA